MIVFCWKPGKNFLLFFSFLKTRGNGNNTRKKNPSLVCFTIILKIPFY